MVDKVAKKPNDSAQSDLVGCGIIMPISATENFTVEHWAEVQTLLHRAITEEGFEPHNVWDDTGTDRISERVIGNIFKFPIVVVDVSDLNPNVMFELGLRLASKKPTVVIQNEGGKRAFDIADFHALHYPNDLSMLKMEKFLLFMRETLRAKFDAAKEDNYVPFLGNVIIDVLAPTQQELPLSEIILHRLDRIEKSMVVDRSPTYRTLVTTEDNMIVSATKQGRILYFVRVPQSSSKEFIERAENFDPMIVKDVGSVENYIIFQVQFPPRKISALQQSESALHAVVSELGGKMGGPKAIVDLAIRLYNVSTASSRFA